MIPWLNKVFDTSQYETRLDRFRASLIYISTSLILGVYLVYAFLVPDWPASDNDVTGELTTMLDIALTDPLRRPAISFYSLIILAILSFVLTRRGWSRYSRWIPIVMWYVSGVLLLTLASNSAGFVGGAGVLLLLLAGLLVGTDGIGVAMAAILLTLFLRIAEFPEFADSVGGPSALNIILQMAGGALMIYLFLRSVQVTRAEAVSDVLADQSDNTLLVRSIAEAVARRVSPELLMQETVNEIQSRYPYVTSIQVYLRSANLYSAQLIAASSEYGQRLLEEKYTILLGTNNVVSQVMELGTAIIDTPDRLTLSRERLISSAKVLVLPLRLGESVLGVMMVQSASETAFDDVATVTAYRGLADSMVLALDNVTQYSRAEERLKDNERLMDETRTALGEIERLNERLTGSAWSGFLRAQQSAVGLQADFENKAVKPDDTVTQSLQDAMLINQIVQQDDTDNQVIAVPLRVRGRVVGAMEFELDKKRGFSPEDFDLLQEVGERFGLAVENARLVDETQSRAQREALVNQISSRLQATNNVETMLNEAAASLRDTLKAKRVAIRLGTPPKS